MGSFREDSKIGFEGEQVVQRYLGSLDHVKNVIIVADDKDYFRRKVDLIWEQEGEEVSGEVKTDRKMAKTGNFFLETTSAKKEGEEDTTGWVFSCGANRLLYLSWNEHTLYDMAMQEVRDFACTIGKRYKPKGSFTNYDHGNSDKPRHTSRGICVPKMDLLVNIKDWQEIDVSDFYSKPTDDVPF